MKIQPTTKELIEMLYERLPELFDRAAPVQEPAFKVGNLVTLTGGEYPGLGQWFVQLWDGDEIAARVYGDDREAINRRVAALNTPPAAQPAPVQPVECQYGNGGYACCEGGPCKADEQNNAAPVQEPVGNWIWSWLMDWCKRNSIAPATQDGLFAMVKDARCKFESTPPAAKRQWVGLTNEEIDSVQRQYIQQMMLGSRHFARAIESKLKEKNT